MQCLPVSHQATKEGQHPEPLAPSSWWDHASGREAQSYALARYARTMMSSGNQCSALRHGVGSFLRDGGSFAHAGSGMQLFSGDYLRGTVWHATCASHAFAVRETRAALSLADMGHAASSCKGNPLATGSGHSEAIWSEVSRHLTAYEWAHIAGTCRASWFLQVPHIELPHDLPAAGMLR